LEPIRARFEVHVDVDEAGQDRVAGQIEDFGARRDGNADGADAVAFDLQRDVLPDPVAGAVEQRSRPEVEAVRPGRRGKQRDEGDHPLDTSSSSTRRRPSALQLTCLGAWTMRCSKPRYSRRTRSVAEFESRKRTPRRVSAAQAAG